MTKKQMVEYFIMRTNHPFLYSRFASFKRRRLRNRLGRVCFVFSLAILCVDCAYFHGNFRTVEPGVLYRSGQLKPKGLEGAITQYGLKTVISLRRAEPNAPWYHEERAVCQRLGVTHYDLPWSRVALPPPESLARLLAILEDETGPHLVHCQGGVHRSAVAAACYLLAGGAPADEARKQFTAFFLDAPVGRIVEIYEGSPVPFRQWVENEYPKIYAEQLKRR